MGHLSKLDVYSMTAVCVCFRYRCLTAVFSKSAETISLNVLWAEGPLRCGKLALLTRMSFIDWHAQKQSAGPYLPYAELLEAMLCHARCEKRQRDV